MENKQRIHSLASVSLLYILAIYTFAAPSWAGGGLWNQLPFIVDLYWVIRDAYEWLPIDKVIKRTLLKIRCVRAHCNCNPPPPHPHHSYAQAFGVLVVLKSGSWEGGGQVHWPEVPVCFHSGHVLYNTWLLECTCLCLRVCMYLPRYTCMIIKGQRLLAFYI